MSQCEQGKKHDAVLMMDEPLDEAAVWEHQGPSIERELLLMSSRANKMKRALDQYQHHFVCTNSESSCHDNDDVAAAEEAGDDHQYKSAGDHNLYTVT
jgi:hypothetical protein